ncbi:hypothetical protein EYR36_007849 [Pleurotus pulmonarius]|nr:hypothetical protein EYR36_007849 [Pleurotus pulmonarius]
MQRRPTTLSKLNTRIVDELREAHILPRDEPPAKLCSGCSEITIAKMREVGGYKHPTNVYELPTSAGECDLCEVLVDRIANSLKDEKQSGHSKPGSKQKSDARSPKDLPRDERYALALEQHGFKQKKKSTSFVVLVQWPLPGMEHVFAIEKFTPGSLGAPGEGLISVCRIYTDSGGLPHILCQCVVRADWRPPAVRSRSPVGCALLLALKVPAEVDLNMLAIQVKRWRRACCASHKVCNGPADAPPKPPLPTRVLDVEKERLYETKHAPGRYIALSHTWGGQVEGRTLKGNLKERLKGFSFDTLPLNFRDAIKVTKALGMRYLWIDSLCIVQDDADDWGREAKTMTGLYMNSWVTIAATRAPDSASGFLGRRDVSKVVKVPGEGGEYFYVCPDAAPNFEEAVFGAPLNRRAWVVQERVLSPRTLHFTQSQVYWECMCAILAEDMNHESGGSDARLSTSRTHYARFDGPKGTTPEGWWSLLENYTACGLTYQSDKLIAIHGIVSWMKSQFELEFLAGVWKDSASVGLLWVAADRQGLEPLPESLAPSWSWASKKGPIKHIKMLGEYGENTSTYISGDWSTEESQTSKSLVLHADICSLQSGLHFGPLKTTDLPFELENSNARYRLIEEPRKTFGVRGWAVLDEDLESSSEEGQVSDHNLDDLYWVVVRYQTDTEAEPESNPDTGSSVLKTPFYDTQYCLLVRKWRSGDGEYVRVGSGAVYGAQRLEVKYKGVKVL